MNRRPRFAAEHEEVVAALAALGHAQRGEAVRRDRGSQLQHLGVGFPALRARVKQGFSFSGRPAGEVLAVWHGLWCTSPVAEVLFAAIEHVAPLARAPGHSARQKSRQQPPPALWPVVRTWADRVDNWCHSDALASLYSHLLQAQFDEVYPQLQAWNAGEGLWTRRLSITSLVHYTGKNAVFLPPAVMLPLLARCVGDHRRYVQLALGWVLRELGRAHLSDTTAWLEQHAGEFGALAWSRAVEKLLPAERVRLMALRNAIIGQ